MAQNVSDENISQAKTIYRGEAEVDSVCAGNILITYILLPSHIYFIIQTIYLLTQTVDRQILLLFLVDVDKMLGQFVNIRTAGQ